LNLPLGQRDLGRRALRLVLVVHLDAGRDAPAVVGHGHRVVGVDRDHDVVAVARQRLVDRVVDHLEHQVVQAGAVRGVADVHARALAHRLQPFEDRDGAFAIGGVAGRCHLDRNRAVDLRGVNRLGVRHFRLVFFAHQNLSLSATRGLPLFQKHRGAGFAGPLVLPLQGGWRPHEVGKPGGEPIKSSSASRRT
jgi:hypothetical protein